MASIKEYFLNDFKGSSIDQMLNFTELNNKNKDEMKIEVNQRVKHDFNSSTRMFTFYVPFANNPLGVFIEILNQYDLLKSSSKNLEVIGKMAYDITLGVHKILFSNRIYIYSEKPLNDQEIVEFEKYCNSKELYVTIRSQKYREKRMQDEKPMAFISHDSRDKALIARTLASSLQSRLCTVWYDEYSLKIGNSLRESIEKGIKEAKKCILILTPNFLSNPGWSKREFNSIFTREMVLNEKIILPIWFRVSAKDVYEYSPSLADTFALQWPDPNEFDEKTYQEKVEQVVSKIHTNIIHSNP